ncbi:MAG: NAD(P)-dependent oxidoreductase [bacterium]|jgi:nucleoside-diphosphate-sugar epimerase|nr:NAD(P)-dependent oxidoreductase [candidate division KSB1 bacterium]MDH7559246.1 NAD(P)-dependent oxidoreductase [bacterium]
MAPHWPSRISDEAQLEDLLSEPLPEVVAALATLQGDILILGVGGKIGPSLARMAKRASEAAGVARRIIGVALFESEQAREQLEREGIEAIHGDLLDRAFLEDLPDVPNVIFTAGMKFGSVANLPLTWAINCYLPALVAERFRSSRIVAFSTGCVYPLVPITSGGSLETDPPQPVGEYAQSCLGRERMFEYASLNYRTPVAIIRLNYAVEMRYGVLVDIAQKVLAGEPIDLSMGHVNVIWQGDVNAIVLRCLQHCQSPALVLNVTGPETAAVRWLATEFGALFGKKPKFIGQESDTALLSNAARAFALFGYPRVPLEVLVRWTADWIASGRPLLHKPTHFEVRNGKF